MGLNPGYDDTNLNLLTYFNKKTLHFIYTCFKAIGNIFPKKRPIMLTEGLLYIYKFSMPILSSNVNILNTY